MVDNSSALLKYSGIRNWVLVRISAILIMLYIIYGFSFFIITGKLTYNVWQSFFDSLFTKIFTLIVLFSILVHGWIGIWQVLTDYIKSSAIRLILQLMSIILLLSYAIYGAVVVWSV